MKLIKFKRNILYSNILNVPSVTFDHFNAALLHVET